MCLCCVCCHLWKKQVFYLCNCIIEKKNVCVCVCVCMCTQCMTIHMKNRNENKITWRWIDRQLWTFWWGFWELNSGPMQGAARDFYYLTIPLVLLIILLYFLEQYAFLGLHSLRSKHTTLCCSLVMSFFSFHFIPVKIAGVI